MSGRRRPYAPFGRRSARVETVDHHGPYVVLTVIDSTGPRPLAGQFYMLRTAQAWGGGDDGRPYLPRALSFARARADGDRLALEFLLEAVGPGTARLAASAAGDELLIAGPFGNGFTFEAGRRPLLVAGGIGLAPIIALDDEIHDLDGVRSTILVGMRSGDHARAVIAYGLDHDLATDDGSAGQAGYVTQMLAAQLRAERESTVYACGPPAMLEAVRELCEAHDVPSQLAMESGMACGFGACFGCVVATRDGYARLCVDGPVLRGEQIETALAAGTNGARP
ncbi:MAG: hypothetical protein WAO61_04700 [Solirubrobacterales bacterium]